MIRRDLEQRYNITVCISSILFYYCCAHTLSAVTVDLTSVSEQRLHATKTLWKPPTDVSVKILSHPGHGSVGVSAEGNSTSCRFLKTFRLGSSELKRPLGQMTLDQEEQVLSLLWLYHLHDPAPKPLKFPS